MQKKCTNNCFPMLSMLLLAFIAISCKQSLVTEKRKEEELHRSFVNCFSLRKAVKTDVFIGQNISQLTAKCRIVKNRNLDLCVANALNTPFGPTFFAFPCGASLCKQKKSLSAIIVKQVHTQHAHSSFVLLGQYANS